MRTRLNETVHSRCHQQLLCRHHYSHRKRNLNTIWFIPNAESWRKNQLQIIQQEKKRNVCIENVYSWELHFRLLFIARLIEAMMAQSLCIFIEEWISLFHHHRFHSNISLYYLQRDMCTAREREIAILHVCSSFLVVVVVVVSSPTVSTTYIGTTPLQMRTATCDELFSAASDRLVIIKEKKIFQTVKQKIGQNATWKREKNKEKQKPKK